MIGRHVAPYEVLEKLGEGGMGEVYRTRISTARVSVAIYGSRPALSRLVQSPHAMKLAQKNG